MDKDSDAEEAKEIVNWLYGTEAHDMSEGLARTLQDRIASALQSKQSIIDGLESKLAGYSGWSPHQFRGVCKKLEALQKKYIELDNKRFKLESDLELAKQLNARYKEALEEFITLRDMESGVQIEIPLNKVVEEMREKITKK